MRFRWVAVLGVPLLLLLPASAYGASASVFSDGTKLVAHYESGPGEVNHVTATVSSGAVTFTDPGKNMAAGNGCTTPGTNTITCRDASPIEGIQIALGNEADWAKNDSALPSLISGGQLAGDKGDTIIGGSGPDILGGHNGNDTIYGNGGNDKIHGDGHSDTLYGNAGNDTLLGDDSGDPKGFNTLYGGDGNDTLIGSKPFFQGGAQTLQGGPGDDFLFGSGGGDTLTGGDGNDLMAPTADGKPDVLTGGPGQDVADYLSNNPQWGVKVSLDNVANDGSYVILNGQHDNVKSDIETVWGGPGSDLLVGTAGAQTLQAFGGVDYLDGGPGPDDMFGGADQDTALYDSRSAPVTASINGVANDGVAGEKDNINVDVENITGGQGDDKLSGDGDPNTLNGGDGGDTLNGLGGDDTLNGEASNDTFVAGPGADSMIGGVGVDTADYTARVGPLDVTLDGNANDGSPAEHDDVHAEQVFGGSGPDQITGDADTNFLEGRAGSDSINGAGGVDFLNGGNGVDTIQGGADDDVVANGPSADGADTVAGGPGSDLSTYQNRTNPLNVSLDNAANDGEPGENDDVQTSVEKVTGGSAKDGLSGSAADNTLAGGGGGDAIAGSAGADILDGNGGADMMFGGDDNDVLQGGTGADAMAGGPGIDKADYSDAPTGIDVTIDDAANDGTPAEGDNVMSTIENVLGGRFDDSILGDADPNTLVGGLGADQLRGAGGPDLITGSSGKDDLRGGAGADELHAVDATKDSLLCGTEIDTYAADGIDTVAPDCENALP